MQPVWVLSVDLQTKTATFQSGLADAAKSARGAFSEIRSGSNAMGKEMGTNMFEARHSVMILGEELGIKLPRALTAFIAGLGPVGAALEAAFPFLAIALGATLLIEHLVKMREEGQKLTDDQLKFGTAVQTAFNALDQKLLQAGIKADELRNDHMGALKLQLESIDHQSLEELVHSFDEVAKAASVVFKDLEVSWYQIGIGSAGASHAMDEFQNKYNSLLAQGKDKEASDLLSGTLGSAQHILAMMKQAKENSGDLFHAPKEGADISKAMIAESELKKAGVWYTEQEVKAQQTLVEALNAQMTIEGKVNALKGLDKANAAKSTGNEMASQQAAAARQAADSMQRLGESNIASDRAVAEAQLSIHQGTIEQRLAMDLDFAQRELDVKQAGNAAQIAALDKSGKDYQNQLKALQEKSLELTQAHETEVTQLRSKAEVEAYHRDLTNLEQAEREKIEKTLEGTAARLAAIDAALAEQKSRGLQETSFYRELLNQRVEAIRQETEEENKLREEAGKEAADHEAKMGELVLAAQKQQQQLMDSSQRENIQRRITQETADANLEYQIKQAALQKEAAALDKSSKDHDNKLKAIQDKEAQLYRQHQNDLTTITTKAEEERNQRILSGFDRFNNTIAQGLTQSIMGHESWAKMVTSLGSQVVSGMMENAIKSMLADDMTKERDAAAAARKAFNIGMNIGGPAGIILGPAFAAAAFTAVMAFQEGTDRVPGVGRGDIVPTMLEPGEGVVPGGVMDGLRQMVRNGGMSGGGPHYHLTAHFAPAVHALDADGVDRVLAKHSDKFQRHMENTLRKMNR
jgi:hypothetical protein